LVGTIFDIVFNSDGSYTLKFEKQDVMVYSYAMEQKIKEKRDLELNLKGNVGEIIETDDFKFLITINDKDNLSIKDEKVFAFKLSTIKQLTNKFEGSLEFHIPDKLATVLEITIKTTSVQQGEEILSELIQVYSESNLAKKNHLANMTIDYIEKQLEEVSTSLNRAGDNLQKFMSKNKTMNVDEQSTRLAQQKLDLQNQLAELMTQKRYYDYVTEYDNNNKDETQIIAPKSMGIQDPLLNNLIGELSTAQTQRANLIKNNQERNPIVNRLDIQIRNLKNIISENIAASARTNEISIKEMQYRIFQLEKEISELPETQMQMGGIERNYNLNNTIYNYLLEKQAEAKITKASNLPDNIVVEPARMVGLFPVSPKRILNYIIALFLGFAIPFGILILKMSLKNTISTQEDIESITNATVLGKVFHYKKNKEKNVFVSSPKDKTAETFRTLRTNINFALNSSSHKTILVTSCLLGEGKTFNALNIAASYAQMGKKTILLNFDLRKPHSIIKKMDKTTGLSLFLNEEVSLNEIIQKTDFKNLDYIHAGPVPPNPLDLMEKEIMTNLFNFLKKNYDYIIIDTPPLAQVSDAITIIKYASLNLIVTRYNVTKKKLLRVVLGELKNKNINNVFIVLNDNKLASEQMGYGYYRKK
jgi:capsular exopolysaccharide synthesis family protein